MKVFEQVTKDYIITHQEAVNIVTAHHSAQAAENVIGPKEAQMIKTFTFIYMDDRKDGPADLYAFKLA